MNKIKFIFRKLTICPICTDFNKYVVTVMKKTLPFLIFVTAVLLSGCASSGNTAKDNKEKLGSSVEIHNPNLGLDEYLRRLSGVRVYGLGPFAKVQMRGESSLELPSTPLFVMDDIRLGRDFDNVYKIVDMNLVNNLTAVNSSKATLYYGHEGYAGVIEISTID